MISVVIIPVVSFAADPTQVTPPTPSTSSSGLIPCGNARYKAGDIAPNGTAIPETMPTDTKSPEFLAYQYKGQVSDPCSFKTLMTLINTVIRFILFSLAVPIAALMFVYAGFQMVTSGGNAHKSEQAKKIFANAVIGLALAAAAWLIIELILSIFGYSGSWIGF